MSRVQYCRTETKTAYLSEEFGEQYATRIFGADVVACLPRYVRGKRAGKIKAVIGWKKVAVGGWDRDLGGVRLPGVRDHVLLSADKPASNSWGAVLLASKASTNSPIIFHDGQMFPVQVEQQMAQQEQARLSLRIAGLDEDISDQADRLSVVADALLNIEYTTPISLEALELAQNFYAEQIACLEMFKAKRAALVKQKEALNG